MFFSLLAASVDGFICGFVLSGLGVKIRFKEFLISFAVIFICCISASFRGKYLAYTRLDRYINLLGGCVMLYLAVSAILSAREIPVHSNITQASLSVAADASVACLYLAMYGHSIFIIATVSAFLHSVLMWCANLLAYKIIKPSILKYISYLASGIFIYMAIIKFASI